MGALILLLLVTTRRIRQQELDRLAAEAAAMVMEEEAAEEMVVEVAEEPVEAERPIAVEIVEIEEPPAVEVVETEEPPVPEPVVEDPPLLPAFYDDYEERLAERRQLIARREAEHLQALRVRDERARALKQRAEEHLASLRGMKLQLQKDLDSLTARLNSLNEQLAIVASQQETSQQLIAGKQGQEAELQKQFVALRAKRAQLESIKAKLEADLVATAQQKPQTSTKFEVVAYDGESGTTRRPILIECRADGLTFAGERITLTPRQLNGFPSEKNPLQAGTEALYEYWKQRADASEAGDDAPYVLMIVRPGGTDAFYVARTLLEEWDHEFGYELVSTDDDLKLPEPDDGAVQVCQNAIDAVLSERDRIVGRLKTGRLPMPAELMFASEDNTFRLPEIEQLRNRRRGFSLGGSSWLPDRSVTNSYESGTQAPGVADTGPPASFFPGDSQSAQGTGVPDLPGPPGPFFPEGSDSVRGGNSAGTFPKGSHEGMARSDPRAPSMAENGSSTAPSRSGSAETGTGTAPVRIGELPPRTSSNGVTFIPSTIEPERQARVYHGNVPAPKTAKVHELGPRSGSESGLHPLDEPTGRFSDSGNRGSQAQSGGMSGSSQRMNQQRMNPLAGNRRGASGAANPFAQGSPTSRSKRNSVEQRREYRPPGAIGIERETVLHLHADRVEIDEIEGPVSTAGSRDSFQRNLTSTLSNYTATWGEAPRSFFWKPTVRIVIHPGGNQHVPSVTELTDAWKVETKKEFSLEERREKR